MLNNNDEFIGVSVRGHECTGSTSNQYKVTEALQ